MVLWGQGRRGPRGEMAWVSWRRCISGESLGEETVEDTGGITGKRITRKEDTSCRIRVTGLGVIHS